MWDDLSTPRALLGHLSAERIRLAFSGRHTSIGDALALGRLLAGDLGAAAFALAPAGVVLGWRRGRAMTAALAASALASILYAVLVNPMGIEDRQVGFLATIACLVLAGTASAAIVGGLRARPALAGAAALALVAAVPLARAPDACRVRNDALAVLWAGSAISGLPPRSLVLCTSDEMCGLSLYLHHVEGARPDVAVVPRQHLWNDLAVKRALDRSHRPLAVRALSLGPGTRRRLALLAGASSGLPVYWEVADGEDLADAFGPFVPPLDYGPGSSPPLARIGREPVTTDALERLGERLIGWIGLVGLDPERLSPCDLGFVARRMLARDFLGVGLVMAWRGDRAGAAEAFRRSLLVKPDYAPALVDLAILEAEAGRLERAIDLARAAVEAEPDRAKARTTLEWLLEARRKR
jgi:hypothetical protein